MRDLWIIRRNDYTILADCGTVTPDSTVAALRQLGQVPGRHIAILEDVPDLGARNQAEHYRMGRIAAENAEILLAWGVNGRRMVMGAITGGMREQKAMTFDDQNALAATLHRMTKPGDTVLFVGSFERLEQLFPDE